MQRKTEGARETRGSEVAGPHRERNRSGTAGETAPGAGAAGAGAAKTRRTQAERDAATLETGYALFSAGFAAALMFGAVAGPALLFALPGLLEQLLPASGAVTAAAVFLVRVVTVLTPWRGGGRGTAPPPENGGA